MTNTDRVWDSRFKLNSQARKTCTKTQCALNEVLIYLPRRAWGHQEEQFVLWLYDSMLPLMCISFPTLIIRFPKNPTRLQLSSTPYTFVVPLKFNFDSKFIGGYKLYLEARWRKHCNFHNWYFHLASVRIEPIDHQTWFVLCKYQISHQKIPFMLIKGCTTNRIFSPFWRCTGRYHSCPRKYPQYKS